ncbi:hypothetical protein BJ912DRAFT_926333 [Pholiota molesta]|nr:hypothetical protein BJ912DRAFT_926333 [Pholiota molesta]
MRTLSHLLARCTSACIVLAFLISRVSASYFVITEPQAQTQWVNGGSYLVSWSKGLLDDVYGFDVELTRLSNDGLTLVAMNVPATQGKLNIMLQNVPAGDDYFLLFINSTHGVMHATSPRFAVLAAGASASAAPALTAAPGVPTVTVSGAPNPTMQFATTFPALPSRGERLSPLGGGAPWVWAVTGLGVLLGAVCVGW